VPREGGVPPPSYKKGERLVRQREASAFPGKTLLCRERDIFLFKLDGEGGERLAGGEKRLVIKEEKGAVLMPFRRDALYLSQPFYGEGWEWGLWRGEKKGGRLKERWPRPKKRETFIPFGVWRGLMDKASEGKKSCPQLREERSNTASKKLPVAGEK